MNERLNRRLDAIGENVRASGRGLALLALGSAGIETERMDAYSDLDFFVIAKPGEKHWFLNDLGWLTTIHPAAFSYRNTVDGFKLLYQDGVLCEFAVFEPDELPNIPFVRGRAVWCQPGFDESTLLPTVAYPRKDERSREWLVGEIVTNLYTGICRDKRGEKLSAAKIIQNCAIDRFIELVEAAAPPGNATADVYSRERRFEQRYPTAAGVLTRFMQGYDRNVESALEIIEYLWRNHMIDSGIKKMFFDFANQ